LKTETKDTREAKKMALSANTTKDGTAEVGKSCSTGKDDAKEIKSKETRTKELLEDRKRIFEERKKAVEERRLQILKQRDSIKKVKEDKLKPKTIN
jgi:hypothetical protein